MAKVSIIVPVYNAQSHISKCIESLLAQSLSEIEIVLVDDGSKDESGNICDAYAQKDKRIKVLHTENGGPARARNKGLDVAKGEYVGFVDSDDYVATDMFEKLYQAISEKKADVVMCGYNVIEGSTVTPLLGEYESYYGGHQAVKDNLLQVYYTDEFQKSIGLYSLCNKLFKRDLIECNQIRIEESLWRGEDAKFVFDVLKTANSFAYIPEQLYYYVQNEESIMHTIQPKQYMHWKNTRKRLLAENEMLHFQIDYNRFYAGFYYKVAVHCRELILAGQKDEVKKILSDAFYRENLKYIKNLPPHIRAIHTLAKIHPSIAYCLLWLWSKNNVRHH